MTNIHSLQERRQLKQDLIDIEERRLDTASQWIAKLDRGLARSEKHSLKKWLGESAKNMKVLLEVAHLWDKMNELSRLADLFPQSPSIDKRNRSKKWTSAIAASIVAVFMTGVYMNSDQPTSFTPQAIVDQNPHKILQTKIGESDSVILPDGSKIVLNTNTLAEVQYTPTARIIELKRGEIHIDVAHNKARPLSVIVGGKIIQAVGTAFNVEVKNQSIELIVTDGKVLVAPVQSELELIEFENSSIALPESSVAISKGEKVNLNLKVKPEEKTVTETIVKVAPIDIAASLSWRQGNLIFRGESLVEAMAEISRYSDVKFDLDDDSELKKIRVAGMFKTGDVTGLLNVLEQNFNIHHQQIDEQRILLKMADSNL